jgi:uncharacterized protein (DUF2267 family)
MQYHAFIEAVRSHGDGIGSRVAARHLTDAFFDTLGERLEHPARDHVGAQLPRELKEILARRRGVEHFTLEEFYKRLGARAGFHYEQAIKKTHIITDVLRRAVPESEISFLLEQLPGEYIELFGPPRGPLSPSAPAGQP